jgi:hypothetical protein
MSSAQGYHAAVMVLPPHEQPQDVAEVAVKNSREMNSSHEMPC